MDQINKKANRAKTSKTFDELDLIPSHVAVIMDGNGRWAECNSIKRSEGHKAGMNQVKVIAKHASKRGVKALTLYAFSTENWKRPLNEVNYLMQLPVDFFNSFMPEIMKADIKVMMIGSEKDLPRKTRKIIAEAVKRSENNSGMVLNFAVNYGGRYEIIDAVKKISNSIQKKELKVEQINESVFEEFLMTSSLGDYRNVDLMIRTSGEQRLSNFLLWQNAYSEFYFSSLLWPDFNETAFDDALAAYQKRNRRYGGL